MGDLSAQAVKGCLSCWNCKYGGVLPYAAGWRLPWAATRDLNGVRMLQTGAETKLPRQLSGLNFIRFSPPAPGRAGSWKETSLTQRVGFAGWCLALLLSPGPWLCFLSWLCRVWVECRGKGASHPMFSCHLYCKILTLIPSLQNCQPEWCLGESKV